MSEFSEPFCSPLDSSLRLPPIEVSEARFSLWKAGLALIFISAISAWAAWRWAWAVFATQALSWTTDVLMAGLLLVLCTTALSLWRLPQGQLSWDGQIWFWQPIVQSNDDSPISGQVRVACDFGVWILARFIPSAENSQKSRPFWMALQKNRQYGYWHALRCALYARLS